MKVLGEGKTVDGYEYKIVSSKLFPKRDKPHNTVYVMFGDSIELMEVSRMSAKKQTFYRYKENKRVRGIGINDLEEYGTELSDKWNGMLGRVSYKDNIYDVESKFTEPYQDVYLFEDWLIYSKFKEWATQFNYTGSDLDKDLLSNSKMYSPETCCFLPHQLNIMIQTRSVGNSGMVGVQYFKGSSYYKVQDYWMGEILRTYSYRCKYEAHKKWQQLKSKNILKASEIYYREGRITGHVVERLNEISEELLYCSENGIITTNLLNNAP